jgi:hypothetical protein
MFILENFYKSDHKREIVYREVFESKRAEEAKFGNFINNEL